MEEKALSYILRKRKFDIYDFDQIFAYAYFAGQFGNKMPVDEAREAVAHLVKLAQKENTQAHGSL